MRNLLSLLLLLLTASALDVPRCTSPAITLLFTYINGTADSTTTASLCHDGAFLFISWSSIDH